MSEGAFDWNELSELDLLLDELAQDPGSGEVGVQLMRESFEHRRALLIEEALSRREATPEHLDLVIQGRAASRRGVDLTVLAKLLSEVQNSISAIAQAITRSPTRRGAIPAEIQELVRLRLSVALPGSLALRLVPAEKAQALTRVDLFGEAPSVLEESIDRLIHVLDQASEPDDTMIDLLAEVGPRSTAHLRELTRLLAESETDAHLRWRSPHAHRETHISGSAAFAFAAILEAVEETERTLVVRGRLVGGSLIRRRFEIELADETVLSGSVTDEIIPQIQRYFGQFCTATLHVRETIARGGEMRETHTLVELAE